MSLRTFVIRNASVVSNLAGFLLSSLKEGKILEVKVYVYRKTRTIEQNKYMWRQLKTIADQVYIDGRKFSEQVWHISMKHKFLPEDDGPNEMCKEGYTKWGFDLFTGERFLVGSTTQLTTAGFTEYMHQVEAFAAGDLGVQFPWGERAWNM